jgi:hypothetical protein
VARSAHDFRRSTAACRVAEAPPQSCSKNLDDDWIFALRHREFASFHGSHQLGPVSKLRKGCRVLRYRRAGPLLIPKLAVCTAASTTLLDVNDYLLFSSFAPCVLGADAGGRAFLSLATSSGVSGLRGCYEGKH